MREILFKAKRLANGKWVEGFYFKSVNPYTGIIEHRILEINGTRIIGHLIDESTLCRYIGKTDKNGKMIWENDVVGFLDVSQYDNGYSEHYCTGQVVWDNETLSFEVTERLACESYEALGECEVIGNIFDNPELLEGGAE